MKRFIKKILFQSASALLAIWLAIRFVPMVEFVGSWQILILIGFLLGLTKRLAKSILNLIPLLLRTLTLGLISLILNMGSVWIIDIAFPELKIIGLFPLFLTTLIIWGLSLFSSHLEGNRSKKKIEPKNS